jgi:adenine-specific DNA-methyltransferase
VALQADLELSHGNAPYEHLLIEGDNFDALRALRATHAGRVKLILIDPPYNTGNRDFVYNDRFVDWGAPAQIRSLRGLNERQTPLT